MKYRNCKVLALFSWPIRSLLFNTISHRVLVFISNCSPNSENSLDICRNYSDMFCVSRFRCFIRHRCQVQLRFLAATGSCHWACADFSVLEKSHVSQLTVKVAETLQTAIFVTERSVWTSVRNARTMWTNVTLNRFCLHNTNGLQSQPHTIQQKRPGKVQFNLCGWGPFTCARKSRKCGLNTQYLKILRAKAKTGKILPIDANGKQMSHQLPFDQLSAVWKNSTSFPEINSFSIQWPHGIGIGLVQTPVRQHQFQLNDKTKILKLLPTNQVAKRSRQP